VNLVKCLNWLTAAALVMLGFASLLLAPGARADTLLLAQTTLISGSESTVDSFTVMSPGTVTVALQNDAWPQQDSLSGLSFMASSGTQVLSSWSTLTSDTESFAVTPGTYFAHITGTATGPMDLGLFSLSVSFAPNAPPIPLPASLWMLLLGLLVVGVVAWRFAATQADREPAVPSLG
jgi:hypothetical protein